MPTIERAIIMAAGEGRRMRPLTLRTPKPLISVNGVRFIDTIIGALHANDIHEIYVVTGYLSEQYASLPTQYPGVTLLHNPDYAVCNNISSAFVARKHFENAIVSEADLLVHNPTVCRRAFERSGYCAFTGNTPGEWGLTLDGAGTIIQCDKEGHTGSHTLIGMSLWTAEDGRKLRAHLEEAYRHDHLTDVYWDELALFRFANEYKLGVREIARGDILEIDTLSELAAVDPAYAASLAGKV